MRWGYVLGPLVLLPLLGALFLVPQPGDEGGLRFDRARLSALECHISAAGFLAFADEKSAAFPAAGGDASAARVER